MASNPQRLSFLLHHLPRVQYAVAYGSAVIKQMGYAGSGMVDYIVAVDNPASWHRENFKMNGLKHYSPLGLVGGSTVARIQEFGAGVYFNVPTLPDNMEAKYAVVKTETLCSELRSWKNLYLSGRLQKPVLNLVSNDRVEEARAQNLEHALRTALLLLPPSFSEDQLFTTISNISYTGDPRMGRGEAPDKPQQIALGQADRFRELYAPAVSKMSQRLAYCGKPLHGTGDALMEQDMDPAARASMFLELPDDIVGAASALHAKASSSADAHSLESALASNPQLVAEYLPPAIAAIVAPTAKVQMVKGFFSFGFSTAFNYILHKLRRAQQGKKPN